MPISQGGRAAFDSQTIWAALGVQVLSKEEGGAEVGIVDNRGRGGLLVLPTFLAFSKSLWPTSCVQSCLPGSCPGNVASFSVTFTQTLRAGVTVFIKRVQVGRGLARAKEHTTCMFFNVLCLFAVFIVFVPGGKAQEKQNSKTPS